jgi:hypothetical protein
MVANVTAWPRKGRELGNHHFDSTVWNDFRFRPGDVVIATYAKSGTTWTQQIVAQLIFGGQEGVDVARLSPWLDLRVTPKEAKLATLEAQQHRRFIKTTCRWMLSCSRPTPSTSTSGATAATWSGACTTTTSTPPRIGIGCSTIPPVGSGHP